MAKSADERTISDRLRRGVGTATIERLAKTGASIDIGESGTQRVTDWPVRQLYQRRLLGRDDEQNARRKDAAERFYEHWYEGQLVPMGSIDYCKPHSGFSPKATISILPRGEFAEYHRGEYRRAIQALGKDRCAVAVTRIVLDEAEPTIVGQRLTGRANKAQARAVAIEYLIDGLDRLIAWWGKGVLLTRVYDRA